MYSISYEESPNPYSNGFFSWRNLGYTASDNGLILRSADALSKFDRMRWFAGVSSVNDAHPDQGTILGDLTE